MKSVWVVVLMVASSSAFAQPKYPATKTVGVSDTSFGTVIKDPYRWLEKLDDKEVEAWFKANAALTDDLLAKIPGRDMLAKEWAELDKLKPASYNVFAVENGRVFYKKTLGGENVGRLFYRQGWTSAEKLLFDPATYKTGVVTTLQSVTPSWDGKYVVVGLTAAGAEYSELRILDVAKGKLLDDTFFPSYGAQGWLADNKTFLYDAGNTTDTKSLEIELDRKVKVHTVGTDFAKDRDLFSDKTNPELAITAKEFPVAWVDESYPNYLIGLAGTVQNEMRIFISPVGEIASKKIAWQVLAQPTDNVVRGFAFYGDYVYAVTHTDAPHYKLVRTSVKHPDWTKAETVLPESADSIRSITKAKNQLFVAYSNGITGRIVKLDLATNKHSDIALPGSGITDVNCPDAHRNLCIVTLSTWAAPTTYYDLDGDRGTLVKSVFNSDVTYPGFDQVVADEVEVPGHDGTMIPLSIIHRKDLALDGKTPTILQGYGAYGISYEPHFSVLHSVVIHGAIVAYCHVRGGSEKGEAWYRAGFKTTKPNTWKDFNACAEYVIKKGYTSAAHLAGVGTSAGGILISRAITERPDLFAAAVCNVCDANATRGEYSPNGPVNTPEFGTMKDETEAKALFEMDGLQHVKKGVKYPALMGVGGWNDPRVSPWEPAKFVAAVRAATASNKPVLMKVNYDNGHFTEDKAVTFKNFAGQYAFMLWQTGHAEFQPK